MPPIGFLENQKKKKIVIIHKSCSNALELIKDIFLEHSKSHVLHIFISLASLSPILFKLTFNDAINLNKDMSARIEPFNVIKNNSI